MQESSSRSYAPDLEPYELTLLAEPDILDPAAREWRVGRAFTGKTITLQEPKDGRAAP